MARPKFGDRVQETTTTTGTGSYTLAGAKTGFRSFASVSAFADGDGVHYTATDGTDWEVGYGILSSSKTVLSRATILASSNSGAAVSWSAGTRDIWCDFPARQATALRTMDGYGCAVSNNSTDPTNDLDIAPGRFRSDDDLDDLELTAVLTKRGDATWAVGSGNGGLDEGTLTDSTYHEWLIKRPDTGVVDALLSRNPDRSGTFTVTIATPGVITWTGHGLSEGSSFVPSTTGALPTGMTAGNRYYVLATSLTVDTFRFAATQGGAAINTSGSQSGVHTAVSSPVMPTNYTLKRRIGSRRRVSGVMQGLVQNGNKRTLKVMVRDLNIATSASANIRQLPSIPVGVKVNAILRATEDGNGTFGLITDIDETNSAVSSSLNNFGPGDATGNPYGDNLSVMTDYSGQIRERHSAATGNCQVFTFGWEDTLGRLG